MDILLDYLRLYIRYFLQNVMFEEIFFEFASHIVFFKIFFYDLFKQKIFICIMNFLSFNFFSMLYKFRANDSLDISDFICNLIDVVVQK